MDHEPVKDAQTALEQRIGRMLAGTAQFTAPEGLAAQVLEGIERGAKVPWWRRSVPEWPRLAQLGFAVTGIAAAAAVLLGRAAPPKSLGTVISRPEAVLRQPATDLHATLNVLSVFHRLADTLAGSLPDGVWYGGIALCAAAYVALFFLVVFGCRMLQAPAATR
jgi:hypothetical protein